MSDNSEKIVDHALAGDPSKIKDLVALELSGRARSLVQSMSEKPIVPAKKDEKNDD